MDVTPGIPRVLVFRIPLPSHQVFPIVGWAFAIKQTFDHVLISPLSGAGVNHHTTFGLELKVTAYMGACELTELGGLSVGGA